MARLDGHDEEPKVQDLELARRLGYPRPRKVRELIARLVGTKEEPGELPGIYVRPTVGRTSMTRGGFREDPVNEYWLTEAEALFVCTRSETKPAAELTKKMIRVFMLARRGELPGQVNAADAKTEAMLAKLNVMLRRGVSASKLIARQLGAP